MARYQPLCRDGGLVCGRKAGISDETPGIKTDGEISEELRVGCVQAINLIGTSSLDYIASLHYILGSPIPQVDLPRLSEK